MKKFCTVLLLFFCFYSNTYAAEYHEFLKEHEYSNATYIEYAENGESFFTAKDREKFYYLIHNFEVSSPYDGILYATFSQKNGSYGAIVLKDEKQVALINGKESDAYKKITNLTFSQDGKSAAFIAFDGENEILFINGEGREKFSKISDFSFLDTSGEKYSFVGKNADESTFFQGREKISSGKSISSGKFSLSGEFAYVEKNDEGRKVISTLGDSETYDTIGDLILSPDGRGYAFTARRNGEWLVVINREEHRGYESSYLLQYGDSSENFAFIGERGTDQILVKNREELGTFEKIQALHFIDGRTIECISSNKKGGIKEVRY